MAAATHLRSWGSSAGCPTSETRLAEVPGLFTSPVCVLQVLAALREMPPARVLALRQQTQFLWAAYFSSVEKVVHTALEVRDTPQSRARSLNFCFILIPTLFFLPGLLL